MQKQYAQHAEHPLPAFSFDTARGHMLESQLKPNRVVDEQILQAFARLPRELFVPHDKQALAYADENVPLGHGRVLLQPVVAGRLLQEHALTAAQYGSPLAHKALVIGAANGYLAALLSLLGYDVTALEPVLELRTQMQKNALALSMRLTIVDADLAHGYAQNAPYNLIIFNGMIERVPPAYAAQLTDGGCLLAVVQSQGNADMGLADTGFGRAMLYQHHHGSLTARTLFDAAVPLLPELLADKGFVF